ncbi:MAG: heavy metal translocating P-type ATPase [Acidimicrobiales bacterium]
MTTATANTSELSIEGMTCSACARSIEEGLGRVVGVEEAHVNFATGMASVRHGDGVELPILREVVESLGYRAPEVRDHDAAEARREGGLWNRFRVAALLTVPLMLISMIEPLRFAGWEWVAAALATPVVFGAGWGFHRVAFGNLRHRMVTMDTLVSVGTLAAWTWSAVVLLADLDEPLYFETGAVIVTLILLGKWFEVRATRRSGDAIRSLADLGARTAELEDGRVIAIDDLEVGMRFRVRPGERIATDGVVVSGRGAIDNSVVTGESLPVEVGDGDDVIGAAINTDGSLLVEARRVGADTALAQIIRLVEQAQGSRARVQRLADRVASVFVPTAIAIALATLAAWLILGHATADAFTAAVAVLIIACPCALGLATPLAILVGTGRAAQLGILIRGAEVLEDSRTIDTIVLDKTGTVTEGRMELVEVRGPAGEEEELLRLAAALESSSEHPIGRAIAAGADTSARTVTGFYNQAGRGVAGAVDGIRVRVGRPEFFDEVPASLSDEMVSASANGRTVVLVGRGGTAEGAIVLADTIKPTSAAAVAALQSRGLEVALLTGDSATSAAAVAESVGIERVMAGVLPDGKADEIRRLQAEGRRVAMVGDGINDAPALATADLGIAIGTGTDVAMQASDLTLVSGELSAAVDAIDLSRRTLGIIKGNLFWAFAYNAAAIPLAALGVLNPMIAAGAMGFSSLFVVGNSLRLRTFRPSSTLPASVRPVAPSTATTSRSR